MSKLEFLQDNLRVFVVPVNILERKDLSTSEKMVYIVLRSFANPHHPTAFPSYATIGKLSSMSRRHAITCMNKLVEKGLVTKEARYEVQEHKIVRQKSNIYHLGAPIGVNSDHQPSELRSPTLVNSDHQPSEHSSPENNHLKKTVRTKSKENIIDKVSQSVLPDIVCQVINENRLTDRQKAIQKVYDSLKNQQGYSDALFVQTLLKEATIKEALNQDKPLVAFERYLRKSLLNNIEEQTSKQEPIPNLTYRRGFILEDKLPQAVLEQMELERQEDELREKGIAPTSQPKRTIEDYPELNALYAELAAGVKKGRS